MSTYKLFLYEAVTNQQYHTKSINGLATNLFKVFYDDLLTNVWNTGISFTQSFQVLIKNTLQ